MFHISNRTSQIVAVQFYTTVTHKNNLKENCRAIKNWTVIIFYILVNKSRFNLHRPKKGVNVISDVNTFIPYKVKYISHSGHIQNLCLDSNSTSYGGYLISTTI